MTAEPLSKKEEEAFAGIAEAARKMVGINMDLNDKNVAMLRARIHRLEKRFGPLNFSSVLRRINEGDQALITSFVHAITTNTTQFFREEAHFKFITSHIVDYLKEKDDKSLRVWCAASSTGQEAYSLAITLKEALGDRFCDLHILSSDVDSDVLRTAQAGIYTKDQMMHVPPHYAAEYFEPVKIHGVMHFKAVEKLRTSVKFAFLNLLSTPYPFQHHFDIIFCRNVMIYFDKPTVERVVTNLLSHLTPGGWLFVGHSETFLTPPEGTTRLSFALYEKLENPFVSSTA